MNNPEANNEVSTAEEHQADTPSLRMISVLTGIAMLSGFLVVFTSQLTAPAIAENQRIAIEQAVSKVIPNSVSHREFALVDGQLGLVEKGGNQKIVYAGYDSDGKFLGVASKASAQGYAGMIYLLYGYDPFCQCIRGIKVLKMTETPGLGDKIITNEKFQKNFEQLDVQLNENHSALKHKIIMVKQGAKKNDWEIDAISGASISSKAVGKALNQSAQVLLPELYPLIEQLKQAE